VTKLRRIELGIAANYEQNSGFALRTADRKCWRPNALTYQLRGYPDGPAVAERSIVDYNEGGRWTANARPAPRSGSTGSGEP
jgi:hypothetical protein